MRPSKPFHVPTLPLPWLPSPTQTRIRIRIRIRIRNPITPISSSEMLRTIRDPSSTLKQILTLFSSAAKAPSFRHNYETYQALIPLLARRRHFRAADVILSIMRRRYGLTPGPTVLVPLIEARCGDGRHLEAVDSFLENSRSSRVFSVLFKTLVADEKFEVVEDLLSKAADLGLRNEVRYHNALIKECCYRLRIDDGIRVFKGMICSGISPDVITFSTLMNPLGKEGRILELNVFYGKMLVMGVLPDATCFKILFRLYWRNRMVIDAVGVLRAMEHGGLFGEEDVSGLDGVGEVIIGKVLKRGSMGFFVG